MSSRRDPHPCRRADRASTRRRPRGRHPTHRYSVSVRAECGFEAGRRCRPSVDSPPWRLQEASCRAAHVIGCSGTNARIVPGVRLGACRAHCGVGLHRSGARADEAHDRCAITTHAAASPWCMYDGGWRIAKLGHPRANVGTVRVESLCLGYRIEDSEVRCGVAPDPATHCQFSVLFARSASTSVSQNHARHPAKAARDSSRETTRRSSARGCASSPLPRAHACRRPRAERR